MPFFFQAEDGIRDSSVTGVQTCALPISVSSVTPPNQPLEPVYIPKTNCVKSLDSRLEGNRILSEPKHPSSVPYIRAMYSNLKVVVTYWRNHGHKFSLVFSGCIKLLLLYISNEK